MWKNIDPGDNMSWSSQYKDFLHVDFIYSMVLYGLFRTPFEHVSLYIVYCYVNNRSLNSQCYRTDMAY